MLTDSDSFLDQVVQIFWDVWTQTQRFQNSQNFVTANKTYLCNTVRITKDNTYIDDKVKENRTKIELDVIRKAKSLIAN